jgi:hypothetical protein
MVTDVEQVDIFPHPSLTVQVIVETPKLNVPLASIPVPLRLVAPVTWYEIIKAPKAEQLSAATKVGIVKFGPAFSQKDCAGGHVNTGGVTSVTVITCDALVEFPH